MIKPVREIRPGDEIRIDGSWYRVTSDPEQTRRTVWVYAKHPNGATSPFAFSNGEMIECR
jgi:hypothetical protein